MIGIIIFTIIALILGTLLVLTDNYFNKETDKIEEYLPGYNCGACGFGSCAGMKEAIQENPENYKKCRLIRNERAIEYFESLK
jgi:Na+-translocating ferredoxin:NAD+ oxidoreductase RNF subunit RnfB